MAFLESRGLYCQHGLKLFIHDGGQGMIAVLNLLDISPTVDVDVTGKIVLIDGFGGPPPVRAFEQKGAIGQIYINPGVDIHWGICTTIWGAPDLDNHQRQPRSPLVSISRPDGGTLEDFCKQAIMDVTNQLAEGERPHQAGDYSFNNIGLFGFFMLLSEMPWEMRQEKGYYPVGGCGMNIAWHTENDTLEIADKDNLMRDLRV